MWTIISKILLNMVISIISDRVVVEGAKNLIVKAVDSKVEGIGIKDDDAKDIIHNITKSGLNSLTKDVVSKVI